MEIQIRQQQMESDISRNSACQVQYCSAYSCTFYIVVTAPLTCGEAVFRRTDQKVLVGFARNVSIETSLESCVRKCLDEQFPCVVCVIQKNNIYVHCICVAQSAVFFYEAGECITNTKTAADAPEAFVDEKMDRVVYFDNGCSDHVVAVDVKSNVKQCACVNCTLHR
jgi:hypothetical protein